MHEFGDVVTINTRKVKKLYKKLSPTTPLEIIQAAVDNWKGRKYVIVSIQSYGYYMKAPCTDGIRGAAHSLTRRIRKVNRNHLAKIIVE